MTNMANHLHEQYQHYLRSAQSELDKLNALLAVQNIKGVLHELKQPKELCARLRLNYDQYEKVIRPLTQLLQGCSAIVSERSDDTYNHDYKLDLTLLYGELPPDPNLYALHSPVVSVSFEYDDDAMYSGRQGDETDDGEEDMYNDGEYEHEFYTALRQTQTSFETTCELNERQQCSLFILMGKLAEFIIMPKQVITAYDEPRSCFFEI